MSTSSDMKVPIRHEALIKRSVAKSVTTIRAKFQLRFFKLFQDELTYWTENGKHMKGSIQVEQMRACEKVEKEAFKRLHMFQIVYVSKSEKMRILYVQGSCFATTRSWVDELSRLIEETVGDKKYTTYHKGAFLKSRWSCCKNSDKYANGCTGIHESDVARTSRLSRNISNVSTLSPGMTRLRRNEGINGSRDVLWRRSPADFLSDDEFTDDEL